MKNKLFFDIGYVKLNKYGEELCGDKMEILPREHGVISILSDGLGSGVKANILATLTSKIAITMLKQGATIEEVVNTIINTLPVCKVRGLAYSTFTIIYGINSGKVYIARFDNPPVFLKRDGAVTLIEGDDVQIADKNVKEAEFNIKDGDTIIAISDGILHAGIGRIMNLGWQEPELAAYISKLPDELSAMSIAKKIITTCNDLYGDLPQDDASCMVLKYQKPEKVTLFTGPPVEKNDDTKIVSELMYGKGKKIVCGGTAASIVSRILEKPVNIDMSNSNPDIPPIAYIKGIDLVTEGVLTLAKALEILDDYKSSISHIDDMFTNDKNTNAVYMLLKILLDEATHIRILFGRRVNPAHTEIGFPEDISSKHDIIKKLAEILKEFGKIVTIEYY